MGKNVTMHESNAISASLAECFVTVGGQRYNFMQAIDLEAKFEINVTEVPILGRTGKGHKPAGWNGTGSATFYFNTSIFRRLMKEYKDSGAFQYFDMQIANEDPASEVGRQTVILKNCVFSGGTLAKFAANEELLEEEMEFYFSDFEMPEEFKVMAGMV